MRPWSISHALTVLLASASFTQASFHRHDQSFTPDYVLEATEQNYTINCQSRRSVVVNGTVPGPPIHLKEGKTTWVRVWNRLPTQNFTMHWHGLTQRTAPFSDGTPLVSQWPIKPNEFFDYELHPDVGDAGTYFYHSHVGFQQVTAYGAIIVKDAEKPLYKYHEEKLVTFGDFYPANDSSIEDGLLADPFRWSGEPMAVTVGANSGNKSFSSASDDSCKPHIIDVEPGKTYRLRFIGSTVISMVEFGIEDHDNLTIIEADGQYTKPVTTDHLQVAPGQRFSALLTTKSEQEIKASNKTQYWIRYETRERPTRLFGYALLRYHSHCHKSRVPLPSTLPEKSPVTLPEITYDWLEYRLESLRTTKPFPRLSEVTRTIYITTMQQLPTGAFVNGTFNGSLIWVQNNLTWQETTQDDAPTTYPPYLVSVYNGAGTPNYTAATTSPAGYDPVTKAFPAVVGETLDIVWLQNTGPAGGFDYHPMHAHGEHYWDLGGGNGTYDAAENEKKFAAGFTPAKRDTTVLYRYAPSSQPYTAFGWRAWRIQVTEDNVGAWLYHCHVAQHAVMGMNTVWVFGTRDQILQRFPTEPYVAGYLEYGGSAYGNDTYDPLVNHYYDGK